jgi:hypothetical protein
MRVIIAGLVLGLTMSSGGRAEDGYLERFVGNWNGGGTARPNLHLPAWRVSCNLASSHGATSVRLSGLCRLRLLSFISKQVDATLVHSPGSEEFTGTYSVDGGPPARLLGRLNGDALRLTVTWPILINGHPTSILRIANDGRGHFTLSTVDPLGLDGTPITTSDLHFTRE